jgi:MFS family permease
MDKLDKRILSVLSAIAFLIMFIEAMMIPVLPQILEELNYSITPAELSWIITGYLLVAAISMPVLAKLRDIYGKKRILLISVIIYAFSVSLSGFQIIYTNLVI